MSSIYNSVPTTDIRLIVVDNSYPLI